MKAIALVVVSGGIAYEYAPEHVDVRIIDRDNVESLADEEREECLPRLPRDVGFENLAYEANLTEGEDFLWEEPENAAD